LRIVAASLPPLLPLFAIEITTEELLGALGKTLI